MDGPQFLLWGGTQLKFAIQHIPNRKKYYLNL